MARRPATSAMPARVRPTFSRRLDNIVLRWQARLDAAWADRFLPWLAAAVLALLYALVALARARGLAAGAPLANSLQAAWLIAEGHAPELTIREGHLLARNLPLAFYPVAWATRLVPAVPLLLCLQAASLGAGVVPLWRIARRVVGLRVGASAALVVAYGAHPAVNHLDLADFHTDAVAVGPLLAAMYFALRGAWARYALAAAFAVAWNADLGILVAGIGLLLVLEGRGRVGLLSVAAGLGWSCLAVLGLERAFGTAALVSPRAFADYGDSGLDVLITMVQNPVRVLGDLVAEPNLRVVVMVLAPLLFLPVLAPRYLVPAMALQSLYFVADVPISGTEGAEHAVPLVVTSFVAASFALARLGRRGLERVLVDRRVLVVVVVAAAGFFLADAGTSPYREPWDWAHRDAGDGARLDAVDLVADDAAVRASPTLLPLLAERREVRELQLGTTDGRLAANGIDAVVLDAEGWEVVDVLELSQQLERFGLELVYRIRGVSVFVRGP